MIIAPVSCYVEYQMSSAFKKAFTWLRYRATLAAGDARDEKVVGRRCMRRCCNLNRRPRPKLQLYHCSVAIRGARLGADTVHQPATVHR